MTRVVKKHDERKGELLDTAQSLFYQKGYEGTSVAEVIEAVGIAKGTFYHYFNSKQQLLDQIIDRQVEIIDQVVDPIVNDPEMKAVDKFNKLYASVGQYKAANREVMVMLVKVLYADENLRLLDRMTKSRINTFAPQLAKVISQGVSEGVFNTSHIDYTATMILQIGTHLGEEFARALAQERLSEADKEEVIERCNAYEKAVARILGAEMGLIRMFDREVIDAFL
jgi:AcrR family transcriptional regulator